MIFSDSFRLVTTIWDLSQVDLVLFGHVHNYERTCAVYKNECKALPKKDSSGIDTYDNSKYAAPVHAIIGMAGFTLDQFPNHDVRKYRISKSPHLLLVQSSDI